MTTDRPCTSAATDDLVTIEPFEVSVTHYRAVCKCGSTATAHTREMAERLRNVHLAYYCTLIDRRPQSA